MSADQTPATPSAETAAAPKAKATKPKASGPHGSPGLFRLGPAADQRDGNQGTKGRAAQTQT